VKRFGVCTAVLAVSLASVRAQVTVEVVPEQEQFLAGEKLPVAVRIINRSGELLRLGAESDWLTFSIEPRAGSVVAKSGEVPVKGEFTLESSQVATKRVELDPYFSLPNPGRYKLTATVRIQQWGRDVVSQPKTFDIIAGSKLWEQEFGVPNSAGLTNSVPEVRKYTLQQANFLKTQLRLYLRVTDAGGGRTFQVTPVGSMVSFSRPEPMVDRFSDLHVLYQDGAHSFRYTVFDPRGEVLQRQTYQYVKTRPRLRTGEDGAVSVIGGVRFVTANDVPPPPPDADLPVPLTELPK
jgi:hypothetical protein